MATTETNEQGCTRIRSIGPQDPYADPVPLKQACLGPHLLEIPQNYFNNQMGVDQNDSFALVLDYPSLEPFKPGERMHLSKEVAARTVSIDYTLIDRLPIQQAMKNQYTMTFSDPPAPEETLDGRIQGEPKYGLTPYRVDFIKTFDYHRSRGIRESAAVMKPSWHQEWLVTRDAEGTIDRIIKCDLKDDEIEGLGEIADVPPAPGMPDCWHITTLPELSTRVRIIYPRVALPRWKEIDDRARELIREFVKS